MRSASGTTHILELEAGRYQSHESINTDWPITKSDWPAFFLEGDNRVAKCFKYIPIRSGHYQVDLCIALLLSLVAADRFTEIQERRCRCEVDVWNRLTYSSSRKSGKREGAGARYAYSQASESRQKTTRTVRVVVIVVDRGVQSSALHHRFF